MNTPALQETPTVVREEQATRESLPPNYQVVLHNDDFTPMDFVVVLLEHVFGFDEARAEQVMMDVHKSGKAVCGVYGKEIAETRAHQACFFAQQSGHPLLCTFEKLPSGA